MKYPPFLLPEAGTIWRNEDGELLHVEHSTGTRVTYRKEGIRITESADDWLFAVLSCQYRRIAGPIAYSHAEVLKRMERYHGS